MIENITTFILQALTAIAYVGIVIMPFYLIFLFIRAFWHDYLRSDEKRRSNNLPRR